MENVNLKGHFLIAMPAMADPRFAKSVSLICEHNADGAVGLVINRPLDMSYQALFKQVGLDIAEHPMAEKPVHYGGPVQTERGFVLHRPAGQWDATINVVDDIALTTSKDILESIANGEGPQSILLTLGYAGWSPGQLEEELAQNAWLSVPADPRVLFDTPSGSVLESAMSLLGINFATLSEEAGHA